MSFRDGIGLALALLLLGGCQRQPAAVILHQRTVVSGGTGEARTEESTQYWTAAMMVVVQPAGHFIVDFNQETTTSVNVRNRTVVRRTFAEARVQVEADNQRKRQETADYPEDARAELERMGQLPSPNLTKVELKPTGRTETIAGYEAREIEFSGNAAKGALWVSDSLPLPLGPAQAEAFRRSTAGMNWGSMQFALAMLEAKGIPLRTVMSATANPEGGTVTNEVVEVRHASLPAELAGAPDEFTRLTPVATP